MSAALLLIGGFILAGLGGEAFVRGSIGVALRLRIPTTIVGLTIAAFATSSPEFSVAINAASAGKPDIALGDGLGSNVLNISLVLALALCFGGLPAKRAEIMRDWVIALLAPVLLALFAFDGIISRVDGIALLTIFVSWLGLMVYNTRKRRVDIALPEGTTQLVAALVYCAVGVGLLIAAGLLIVDGAKLIGQMFGISPFIIGATLVALGTSMPELATTLISRLRGHHEIGLGTILGSNIFNVFLIVAVAALIHPITVNFQSLLPVLGVCIITTMLTFPTKHKGIPRWRGFVLLVIYAAYVISTLLSNH